MYIFLETTQSVFFFGEKLIVEGLPLRIGLATGLLNTTNGVSYPQINGLNYLTYSFIVLLLI